MDSVFLAKAGMKVIAWDISKEMVRITTQRIMKENLQHGLMSVFECDHVFQLRMLTVVRSSQRVHASASCDHEH